MPEREDILEALAAHRGFLLFTVQGLSDEQARLKPTVSELTLGGMIKHVAMTERQWVDFILAGPDALAMTEERTEELGLAPMTPIGPTSVHAHRRGDGPARRTRRHSS